jgi:hypothetical protein
MKAGLTRRPIAAARDFALRRTVAILAAGMMILSCAPHEQPIEPVLPDGGSPFVPPPPPPTARLEFMPLPDTIVSGTLLPLEVRIVGEDGRPVTSASAEVTISLAVNPGHDTLSGTTTVGARGGSAWFDDVRIGKAAGGYQLLATASGVRVGMSQPFVVIAGPAAALAFLVQPSMADPGAGFTPLVQVSLTDSAGNRLDEGAARQVALTMTPSPSGAQLIGGTVDTLWHGLGRFLVMPDRPGTGLTIRVASPGLRPAISDTFTVRPSVITAPEPVPGGISFVSLSNGDAEDHWCGITADQSAWCWGLNDDGQLGDGTRSRSAVPVKVAGDHRFTMVTSNRGVSCGLDTSGDLHCWGGAAGTMPARVNTGGRFTRIGGGTHPLCGLTTQGGIRCHRDGTPPDEFLPALGGASGFTDLSVGNGRVCGMTAVGGVQCEGGMSADDSYFIDVPQPENAGLSFSSLSVEAYHSCGIATAGGAYCWGHNQHIDAHMRWTGGELGDGTLTTSLTPVAVQGGHHFVTVVAGFGHSCGVTQAGEGYCWGTNEGGALGLGAVSSDPTTVPARIVGNLTLKAIYAGNRHTCALTTAGAAWCWGANYGGEIRPF